MQKDEPRSRREFLLATLPATLFAMAAPVDLMGACVLPSTLEKSPAGIYSLKMADYPILQQVMGSVRISISSLNFKILVTRVSQTEIVVVSEVCTHHGCAIGDFDAVTERFTCPCHFSQYAADGTVLRGPTIRNLERFPVTWDGGELARVEIEELASAFAEQPENTTLRPILLDSSSITVRYDVERPMHVQITVHSVSGAEVLRVIDRRVEAGTYSVVLENPRLPQGVLFCRMRTSDGYIGVEKFVHP